jgi:ornithine decarboxylase
MIGVPKSHRFANKGLPVKKSCRNQVYAKSLRFTQASRKLAQIDEVFANEENSVLHNDAALEKLSFQTANNNFSLHPLSELIGCNVHDISSIVDSKGISVDDSTSASIHNSSHREDTVASKEAAVDTFARELIKKGLQQSSFLICDLGTVSRQLNTWRNELPMVNPMYAVKCKPSKAVIKLLAKLGCGFDCATEGEISLVRACAAEAKLSPPSIVYANPSKMISMLRSAARQNVSLTVFDGEDELHKIASMPEASKFELLLRLATHDESSVCQFSVKFGATVAEAPDLLRIARDLNLNVVGCAFHVGSGCGDPKAYSLALHDCETVFGMAASLGMPPLHIVDIGGGFPGDESNALGDLPTFPQLAQAVRQGISALCTRLNRPPLGVPSCPDSAGGDLHSRIGSSISASPGSGPPIRFIAEPGRFFVSASTSVITKVYGRKGGAGNTQALYVDDGVYGSFNNVVYDHYHPIPKKLTLTDLEAELGPRKRSASELERISAAVAEAVASMRIPTAIFGPTCDGLDHLCDMGSTLLERCQVGDWLLWMNMGAYTHTASFVFNGYTHIPQEIYVASQNSQVGH